MITCVTTAKRQKRNTKRQNAQNRNHPRRNHGQKAQEKTIDDLNGQLRIANSTSNSDTSDNENSDMNYTSDTNEDECAELRADIQVLKRNQKETLKQTLL